MSCPCACHKNHVAKHSKPCCRQCPKCKSNFTFGSFPAHLTICAGTLKLIPETATTTKTITIKEKETIKITDEVITSDKKKPVKIKVKKKKKKKK